MPQKYIRVIHMGQAIAGPIVGTFLRDLRADVITIGRPTGDVWRVQRCKFHGESFNRPSSCTIATNGHSLWILVSTTG